MIANNKVPFDYIELHKNKAPFNFIEFYNKQ